jgi:MFS family permease
MVREMIKKFFPERLLKKRDFFIVFVLLFNALSWYYMILIVTSKKFTLSNVVWSAFYLAIVISSVIGSFLSDKIERLRLLCFWMILGVAASIFLAFLQKDVPTTFALLILSFLGFSFGVGMPSCLAYFGDYTNFENRGSLGGIIFLFTILTIPFVATFFQRIDLIDSSVISAIWRGLGLTLFFMGKTSEIISKEEKHFSYKFIIHDKPFILYLIPWLMFSFINQFESSILRPLFQSFFGFSLPSIGPAIGAIVSFLSGFLSDRIGRKRIIICGFIFIGIGYATLGIMPNILFVWYIFLITEGVAWGIFYVHFVMVLWGDLSKSGSREKYYVVGSIPFFSADIIGLFLSSTITSVPTYAVFSFASFFLFLAVLPLMYAPETLPEKKLEARKLKQYIEEAKKLREKHVKRNKQ